jgi:hypothetical protein
MGKRVAQAEHLGGLLTQQTPSPPPDRTQLVQWLSDRHAKRGQKLVTDLVAFPAEQRLFTDLQRGMLTAERHLHSAGHPPGQP